MKVPVLRDLLSCEMPSRHIPPEIVRIRLKPFNLALAQVYTVVPPFFVAIYQGYAGRLRRPTGSLLEYRGDVGVGEYVNPRRCRFRERGLYGTLRKAVADVGVLALESGLRPLLIPLNPNVPVAPVEPIMVSAANYVRQLLVQRVDLHPRSA